MNFHRTVGLAGMLALMATSFTVATEYQIDPAHSEILFKVRHMGINTVTGRFENFTGSFTVDPAKIEATKGSATIEAKSIHTANAKRDGHLRSPDFFDVEKFPQITFIGKEVKNVNKADSTCDLVGDLAMHGVTKPITLKVKGNGILAKDMMGKERAAFTASGVINRKDWGLTWNKVLEAGGVVVSEEVSLEMAFQGIKQDPVTAKTDAAKDAKKADKKEAKKELKQEMKK